MWTGLYTPPSAHPAEGSSTDSDPQDQTENTTTDNVTSSEKTNVHVKQERAYSQVGVLIKT